MVRNKPSGLVNNWPCFLANGSPTLMTYQPPTPTLYHPSTPTIYHPSTPMSSTVFTMSPSPSAPSWHPQLSMDTSSLNMFQHSPQVFHDPNVVRRTSPLPSLILRYLPMKVYSLPRKHKDEATGKTHVPGLKDLPLGMQSNFRNTFIHRIMKLTLSGDQPWNNPTVAVYQKEFNNIYPQFQYQLCADDAVILPVSAI